jgi:hypothetical protein
VEGTRVVIVAESNQPLESAWIDFDCDGSRDLKLKVGASDLARATGSFVLQMNPERTSAEHVSYRLLFQPRGTALAGRGQVEAEKLEHRIEVQADLAPEISIEEPLESPARVPPGAPVTVRVRALDPDFGLAEWRVQRQPATRARAARGGGRKHARIPWRGRRYAAQPAERDAYALEAAADRCLRTAEAARKGAAAVG